MSIPWSVKGIDPKARDAARDAAKRHGLSLGEWLNQAILAHEEAANRSEDEPPRSGQPAIEVETVPALPDARFSDRLSQEALERLAERIEMSERRAALALTGLDRTVLGLASRVEEAESEVREAAQLAQTVATEAQRATQEALTRLAQAHEAVAQASQEAEASQALLQRVAESEAALRVAAQQAMTSLQSAQGVLETRVEAARTALSEQLQGVEEAFRREQAALAERLDEASRRDGGLARSAQAAVEDLRRQLDERIDAVVTQTRIEGQQSLDGLTQAFQRIEGELSSIAQETASYKSAFAPYAEQQDGLAQRLSAAEQAATETVRAFMDRASDLQRQLETRLSQAEAAAREDAARIRMGAVAAINQIRAAQMDIDKRIADVEARSTEPALDAFRAEVGTRLEKLERDPTRSVDRAALHMIDQKVGALANALRERDERIGAELEGLRSQAQTSVEAAVSRLAERLERAERAADTALRTLEERASDNPEIANLRASMEERLGTMAASVSQLVGDARAEFAERLGEAAAGGAALEELNAAMADVNRRVAAAERRQAQTIEAISTEIRRMAESVDNRLRTLESRNEDAAGEAVREEVSKLAARLDARISEIQDRDISIFDRLGAEMGRLAERVDERFEGVERRSAEAIELIGEQVARVSERMAYRQDQLARDLVERVVESEERQGARLSDAVSSLSERLLEMSERAESALSPVQKAMTTFATRLQAIEDGARSGDGYPSSEFSEEPLSPGATRGDLRPGSAAEFASDADLCGYVPPAAPDHPEEAREYLNIEDYQSPLSPHEILEEPALEATEINGLDLPYAPAPYEEPHSQGPMAPSGSSDAQLDLVNAREAAELLTHPEVETLPPTTRAAPASTEDKGGEDYLAAARRAAQDYAQRSKKGARTGSADQLLLRGRVKVVLWSAVGVLAIAVAGAQLFGRGQESEEAHSRTAEPAATNAAGKTPSYSDDSIGAAIASPPAQSDAPSEGSDPGANSAPAKSPRAALDSGPVVQTVRATPSDLPNTSLERAAQRGDAVAQYELALRRLARGENEEGLVLLQRSATQGLAMAQYRLGKIYERGEAGEQRDLVSARRWTERAAAAGNRKAMHDLGVFYARGEGGAMDEAAAYHWFRQAAELGVTDSQYNVGVLHQQGRGAPADMTEALYWFTIAAANGDEDAGARAAVIEARMDDDAVAAARTRAETFAPRQASARANGEFGRRVWSRESTAQVSDSPRG